MTGKSPPTADDKRLTPKVLHSSAVDVISLAPSNRYDDTLDGSGSHKYRQHAKQAIQEAIEEGDEQQA